MTPRTTSTPSSRFPLPKVDLYYYSEAPLGEMTGDPVNFVGFEVRENGKPIATHLQARAFHDTRDVTAQVLASGLPIGVYSESFNKTLAGLPAAKLHALEQADLMEVDGDSRRPKWTVELMYYWTEHFPAGKTVVIEHQYKPVTGQQFFGRFSFDDHEQAAYWNKNFCLDAATSAALHKGLDAMEKVRGTQSGTAMYIANTTGFVLTTGNNWKGPIGRFHVTIDKVRPENILSLCWDAAALRKTGPARFESTVTNFAPKGDINIAVFQSVNPQ